MIDEVQAKKAMLAQNWAINSSNEFFKILTLLYFDIRSYSDLSLKQFYFKFLATPSEFFILQVKDNLLYYVDKIEIDEGT